MFAAGYIFTFTDDGPDEEQVLHIGTRDDCERTLSLLCGVAYSGKRPLRAATGVVVPVTDEQVAAYRNAITLATAEGEAR